MASKRARHFSDAQIAEAALEIIGREGASSLSFRRLAEVLGTYHVAVFRQCGSFDGLLDICADHAAASFPEIDDTVDWATATELRFQALYELWSAHVDLILLMRGRAWLGENITIRFYEPAMRTIVDAGMSASDAADLFSILYRLTIGSVVSTKGNSRYAWDSQDAQRKLGFDRVPTLARINVEVKRTDMDTLYRDELRRIILGLGPSPVGQPAVQVG